MSDEKPKREVPPLDVATANRLRGELDREELAKRYSGEAQRAILDRTVQHFEDVAELVKAARALDTMIAYGEVYNDDSEVIAFRTALKPFEGKP